MMPESPIAYGYERTTLPALLQPGTAHERCRAPPPPAQRPVGVDTAITNATERMRARTIVRWTPKADELLVSGLLDAGDEMAGRATVVDAPLGSGHVVLFGTRPMWRWQSQGAFALMLNAMANWSCARRQPARGDDGPGRRRGRIHQPIALYFTAGHRQNRT